MRGMILVLLAVLVTVLGNSDSGVGAFCCGIIIVLSVLGAFGDNNKKQKQAQQQSQGQVVNINISPEMLDDLIEKRKRERGE